MNDSAMGATLDTNFATSAAIRARVHSRRASRPRGRGPGTQLPGLVDPRPRPTTLPRLEREPDVGGEVDVHGAPGGRAGKARRTGAPGQRRSGPRIVGQAGRGELASSISPEPANGQGSVGSSSVATSSGIGIGSGSSAAIHGRTASSRRRPEGVPGARGAGAPVTGDRTPHPRTLSRQCWSFRQEAAFSLTPSVLLVADCKDPPGLSRLRLSQGADHPRRGGATAKGHLPSVTRPGHTGWARGTGPPNPVRRLPDSEPPRTGAGDPRSRRACAPWGEAAPCCAGTGRPGTDSPEPDSSPRRR